MSHGVVYVAYGPAAIKQANESIKTLRRHHPAWEIAIIGEERLPGTRFIKAVDPSSGTPGRWAKTQLDVLSPFDNTLFLDADTRVYGNLGVGFDILKHGWELIMVPSLPQGEASLKHLSEEERDITFMETMRPLQLNTGVIWFRKTEAVKALFAEWRSQWRRFRDKDQGAFLRALELCPVSLWLLGRPFNAGAVVGHLFGRAAN
jgi:hypothetical protein